MRLPHLLIVVLTGSLFCPKLPASGIPSPKIFSVYPLGAQQGTSVTVEILGEFLSNTTAIEFDCRDLVWTKTTHINSGKVSGIVSISPHAPLGPHILRAVTLDGYSTSDMFNVGQYPSLMEAEPNDLLTQAQEIPALPVEIQGRMEVAEDRDLFRFRARSGERWTFDLRSIEYGSGLEAQLFLLDKAGNPIAFNDDRDDFDETPYIEHVFDRDGEYYLKLDQFRGVRGFSWGKNSTYTLRISQLPQISHVSPLGAQVGSRTRVRVLGNALEDLQGVYLTELRRGEYARMTYPYTMPIHFRPDPPTGDQVARIDGRILSRTPSGIEVEFLIPDGTSPGLWHLWATGSKGTADSPNLEISNNAEYDETKATQGNWRKGAFVINGILEQPGEQDVFRIDGLAGQPLHFWTLAAQLGGRYLDTVLQLRDGTGRKLAENDDVVPGIGTLIGNPDSTLFYTPQQDGPVFLTIKDRMGRGGPGYQYRLNVKSERPGFQLVTIPENFVVPKGDSAELKVYLIREAGFEGDVSVWFEGMPPGLESSRGKFRADQHFEPNADGNEMIIPEISFPIHASESVPVGSYPIRILGVPSAEEQIPGRQVVEAQTAVVLGPLLDGVNFLRRPVPQVSVTVCDPFAGRLTPLAEKLELRRGDSTTLALKAEGIPEEASFHIMNLPSGVTYRLAGRQEDQVTLTLEVSPSTPVGLFEISVETKITDRWASSRPIPCSVVPAPKSIRSSN